MTFLFQNGWLCSHFASLLSLRIWLLGRLGPRIFQIRLPVGTTNAASTIPLPLYGATMQSLVAGSGLGIGPGTTWSPRIPSSGPLEVGMGPKTSPFWSNRIVTGKDFPRNNGRPCPRYCRQWSLWFKEFKAITTYIGAIVGPRGETSGQIHGNYALDSTFLPIAVLGILRFLPALWLSDEYDFTLELSETGWAPKGELDGISMSDFGTSDNIWKATKSLGYYLPHRFWPDQLLRILTVVFILLLWLICFIYMWPWIFGSQVEVLTFTMNLMYQVLLGGTTLIFSFYFVLSKVTTSTTIPCINSLWYKGYTAIVFGLMILAVGLTAIETRKTPCGSYTTRLVDGGYSDLYICPGSVVVGWASNGTLNPMGLATKYPGYHGSQMFRQ